MNCKEFSSLLDDFVDGLLAEEEAKAIRRHVATCGPCAEMLAEASVLAERVAALPRSVAPPRDLWPGIASRIDRGRVVRGRFGQRWMSVAAAALLVAASLTTAYLVGRRHSALEVQRAPSPGHAMAPAAVLASFEQLGVYDYEATRRELVEVLQERRGELAEETLSIVLTNLEVIDDALARIAAALGEDPGNELLQRQLISVYRQQVDLLERAAMLPADV